MKNRTDDSRAAHARISIIVWQASFAILTGGALLAALAQGLDERARDRCSAAFRIEPCEQSASFRMRD